MGKDLFDSFKTARLVFEEVDDTLKCSISKSMFFGTQAELARTELTQPALLAHSVAAFRIAQEECGLQLHPTTVVMGHSVGEFGALVASSSMSLADAARLLQARGKAMQEAADRTAKNTGGGGDKSNTCMKALLLGQVTGAGDALSRLRQMTHAVAEICDRVQKDTSLSVQMAALNSPQQLVLSGHTVAVDAAVAAMKADAMYKDVLAVKKAIPLPVSAPFHSIIMEPARCTLEQLLYEREGTTGPYKVSIAQPKCVFVSNVLASPVRADDSEGTGVASIRQSLVQCVTSPVLWAQSVQSACDGVNAEVKTSAIAPVRVWLEVGCGVTLSGLVKQIVPTPGSSKHTDAEDAHTVVSVGTVEDIKALKDTLKRFQLL